MHRQIRIGDGMPVMAVVAHRGERIAVGLLAD